MNSDTKQFLGSIAFFLGSLALVAQCTPEGQTTQMPPAIIDRAALDKMDPLDILYVELEEESAGCETDTDCLAYCPPPSDDPDCDGGPEPMKESK